MNSGSPEEIALSPLRATVDVIAATLALVARGATMLRAKRAIERALDQGDAVIALPMVENVRSLTDELATAGLTVTVRSVLDQELKENFAVRLKELRARLGMSQEDFARDYDLQKKTVQGWELGKKVPDHGNRLLIRMIEKDPAAVRRLVNGA